MKFVLKFLLFFTVQLLVISCSQPQSSSSSELSSLYIPTEDNFTDYDKEHVNNYNFYLEAADSLWLYANSQDLRNMGLSIEKMNKVRSNARYWGRNTNPKLKERIITNITSIDSILSAKGVPEQVTYRIYLSEVFIKPDKDGVVKREGYNPMNNFDLYHLDIDEEGYVIKTVRRDNKEIDVAFPSNPPSKIKDLGGEYTLNNFNELKVERVAY